MGAEEVRLAEENSGCSYQELFTVPRKLYLILCRDVSVQSTRKGRCETGRVTNGCSLQWGTKP